ncbi:MAG: Gfo/Idh/MocA family oxidoreductase [Oscillospiraceae bacterium]|nr:Gfo/Idh/MocA family oxidoreductase [Oscillospiraceae bacterium]
MYRYAIIGFGGLGKLHLINLLRLESERKGELKLCAICGADKETVLRNVSLNLGTVDISDVDFSECNFYTDYKELIEKERPDFILSALPTYLHEEAAVYALSKGVHVFSEKPMALTVKSCDNIIEAAKKNDRKLMIGQSLRFSPAILKLKEIVDNETYGKVCRYDFSRFSQTPTWSWNNWILNPELSGGCVMDLHIHDVDMVNWFFGKPKAVHAIGTSRKVPLENVIVRYDYDDVLVTGSADWSMSQKFPFNVRCIMNFERASAVVADGKLIIYTDDEVIEPELVNEKMHYLEIKAFVEMILDGKSCDEITTPESVRDSVRIVLAEVESIKTKKEVLIV